MAKRRLVHIEVKDKAEGENIERALQDPATRAFVVIVGALLPLGDRARRRVLTFVNDKLNEDAGSLTVETYGDGEDRRHAIEASRAISHLVGPQ